MKKLIAKLQSRKFLLTVGTIGYGVVLIRSGNVTEGVALITGVAGTYNIGQGMADAKKPEGILLEASVAQIGEPIARQN